MVRSMNLAVICAGVLLVAGSDAEYNWPKFERPSKTEAQLDLRENQRPERPISYKYFIKDHAAFGDYLNYGLGQCKDSERDKKDENGVVRQKINGAYQYHPLLSAQCGLKSYGRFLRGENSLKEAVSYANNLVDLQDKNGGFAYPFKYNYYLTKKDLPVGWISGMTQGQGLSLLARVYMLTRDEKYLASGIKALKVLGTPVDEGGVKSTLVDLDSSLSDYIFFEEYVSRPSSYTLNGFLFALLGLYDWSQIPTPIEAQQSYARELFSGGIRTLEKILPYYDFGRLSCYDLGYITFKADPPNFSNSYHGVHIYLLHALYLLTGIPTLKDYEERWVKYAQDPPE
jgi:hypothetical protein